MVIAIISLSVHVCKREFFDKFKIYYWKFKNNSPLRYFNMKDENLISKNLIKN